MNQLYQHGTLALLVPGLFAGTQSIAALMAHGDTGIGTLAGLDGELIILDGVVYQVNAEGKVRTVAQSETVPFANVHHANFGEATTWQHLDDQALRQQLTASLPTVNAFSAVRLHGRFDHVTTRAVAKQSEPYPTLKQTAEAQAVFEADDVTGTLIGYFAPTLFAGVAAPGWHLHFLSDDHLMGGHVLQVDLASGTHQQQLFDSLDLHLPVDDQKFANYLADVDQAVSDIAQAES